MSINMADVKQIMYGNKEVTRIEDSLGNILWQKIVPSSVPLYYINGTTAYKLDMINKTRTTYTTVGAVSGINGSRITEYNGQLYITAGALLDSPNYLIDIDDDNQTITYTLSNIINLNGNAAFKIGSNNYAGDGTNPAANIYIANSSTVKWAFGLTNNRIYANGVLKYNNKYISKRYNDNFAEYDSATDSWITNNMSMPVSSSTAYQFWVWNDTLYYSYRTTQKVYDPINNTWSNAGWTGQTNFNGARLFTDGTNAYLLGGTSTDNIIYKLNGTAWEEYWRPGFTGRGDYLINKYGAVQLVQNARPKIE